MWQYIAKRIANTVLILVSITLLVFLLFNGLGDPAQATAGQNSDIATLEAIKSEMQLDRPLPAQFLSYLNDISPISLHDNTAENQSRYHYLPLLTAGKKVIVLKKPYLRRSYQSRRPVADILLEALPQTLILAFTAMTLAVIFGIVLGIIAALQQHRFADNFILGLSALGISQPSYFSAILLALVFGYWLHNYTGLPYIGSLFMLDDYGDDRLYLRNLVLPAIALGIRPIAIITQLTRSSMLDVMSQDYIRTAFAKGLSERVVWVRHALRNALNPVLTAVSGWLADLLSGAYFIEIVFDYKGLGYITVRALENLDFPVAMAAVLLAASLFVLINLMTDILYGWLDPRVSLQGR